MAELLIAEDEENIREGLVDFFVSCGYRVRAVADGSAVVAEFVAKRPDLVLLDVMMPAKDGFAALSEIRRRDQLVPVLLLTALGHAVDKIKGLGLGADDYVTKPFELDVLQARVSRALQRVNVMQPAGGVAEGALTESSDAGGDVFTFAGLKVDPRRMCLLSRNQVSTSLTPRELGILRILARHPGEVLGREHLLGTLWGVGYFGNTRTLDQHIAALRRKLGDRASSIETVFRTGYRYLPPGMKGDSGD